MPGVYSDKYKTLLNTLRVSDRLSIDLVCLLSACHEVYAAFLRCPVNYPPASSSQMEGCVRRQVEGGEAEGEAGPELPS